jgi:hypothetical protein
MEQHKMDPAHIPLLLGELESMKEAAAQSRQCTHDPVENSVTVAFEGFEAKRQAAVAKAQWPGPQVCVSTHFSAPLAYHFMLQVTMNGDTEASAGHIGVYLYCQKGPHDGLLCWPFNRNVAIEVLKQGGRGGVASKRTLSGAAEYWTKIGRPTDEKANQSWGIQHVVTHQELLDEHCVDDGTLYVKVTLGKAVS